MKLGIGGNQRADNEEDAEKAGKEECRGVHARVEEVGETDQSEKRSKDKGDGGHA
jgi:hypothetical protein